MSLIKLAPYFSIILIVCFLYAWWSSSFAVAVLLTNIAILLFCHFYKMEAIEKKLDVLLEIRNMKGHE